MAATVAEVAWSSVTEHPYQRKLFYALGRYWVFFRDTGYWKYCHSSDGVSWSDKINIVDLGAGAQSLSLVLDGNYIHYARIYTSTFYNLYYRRGELHGDGSITWGAEQLVRQEPNVTDFELKNVTITIDSNGYPWIGYLSDSDVAGAWRAIRVVKSSEKDGTWATETDWKLDQSVVYGAVVIVPLTAGKMYAVYYRHDTSPPPSVDEFYGKLYDGTWGDAELITEKGAEAVDWCFSAVAVGDDIHLVHAEPVGEDLAHYKRTYGAGWGSKNVVFSPTENLSCSLSKRETEETPFDLICFWVTNARHIYYRLYRDGAWVSPSVDWVDESGMTNVDVDSLISYYNVVGEFALAWSATGTRYVRFAASYLFDFDTFQPTQILIDEQSLIGSSFVFREGSKIQYLGSASRRFLIMPLLIGLNTQENIEALALGKAYRLFLKKHGQTWLNTLAKLEAKPWALDAGTTLPIVIGSFVFKEI